MPTAARITKEIALLAAAEAPTPVDWIRAFLVLRDRPDAACPLHIAFLALAAPCDARLLVLIHADAYLQCAYELAGLAGVLLYSVMPTKGGFTVVLTQAGYAGSWQGHHADLAQATLLAVLAHSATFADNSRE